MSLTRKMLKAMGIEEDAIEQIIEAHTETTDSLKAERDRYRGEAGKADELREELERVRGQLKQASSTDQYDELKRQYDESQRELDKLKADKESLQSEFDEYKADAEANEERRHKEDAYKALLEEAGVSQKYVGKVLRVADLDSVEFDDDGNVKDADSLKDAIKSDWGEFIAKTETHGSNPATPPEGAKTEGVSERAKGIIDSYYEKKYGKTEE